MRVLGRILITALMLSSIAVSQSPTPVSLGSAATFAILASSTVTNTGSTTINGDVGVSPGTGLTGAPTVNGMIHLGDTVAAHAQLDLTTAYNDAAGRTVGAILVAGNLGGQTLTPGLYKSTSSLEISSGNLTLDAQGDTNAVFIFQMGSTLTTTSGLQVILSGNARASNIFWQVGSSATFGTTSVFKGTIMALASITLTTGATLDGRALARTGAVTLDGNTITTVGPLPIFLTSFSGSIGDNNNVELSWSTLSETINYGFFVERRLQNTLTFAELPDAFVAGAGTTLEPHEYTWTDHNVAPGMYDYRLRQVDLNGNQTYTYKISLSVSGPLEVVDDRRPVAFSLHQNYPNPFNPATVVEYTLPTNELVTIKLFNTLGQKVRTLVDEFQTAGFKSVQLDAGTLPSGLYFYRMTAGPFVDVRRMVLLK
jgi:hypothetical protein